MYVVKGCLVPKLSISSEVIGMMLCLIIKGGDALGKKGEKDLC